MAENPSATFGGPIPTPTWIDAEKVPNIIEDYLKRGYYRAHFKAMAQIVEEILDKRLKEAGVDQFKLYARAKDKESLQKKLINRYRNENKHYKDFDEIKRDIVDLAGVRIILYMPSNEKMVKDVIQKEWGQGVIPKKHPPPRDPREEDEDQDANRPKYRPRHLGYRATHYRVSMKNKSGEISNDYDWLEHDQVEIQVVSALTHAWAEVGHDVLYKTYEYGPPSLEEERTLDALNGLIHSGDLLLEQFQQMLNKRIRQPFEHREQLTSFLRSYFNSKPEDPDLPSAEFPRGEGIYILFKFLESEKLNSPKHVRSALEQLKYPQEHHNKEMLISRSFIPHVELAPKMSVIVCLIRHLLREKAYEVPLEPRSARDMCAIMMSALTMLEFALGGPEAAKDYLQKTDMNEKQMKSINFLLESPKRHTTLEGELGQDMVKFSLQDSWLWFRTGASTAKSFCGFLFRLAEMGCRKKVGPVAQLDQLHIEPLSRSNTMVLVGEADEAGASERPVGEGPVGQGPVGEREGAAPDDDAP